MNGTRKSDVCYRTNGCIHPINCSRLDRCLHAPKEEVMDREVAGMMTDKSTEQEKDIHHFSSGASSSAHLPPYECLTLTLIKRSALRMQKGFHYGKHNWKKGKTDKAFIVDRLNHAIEHLIKAQQLIENDVNYDDDDLAGVVVNCMMAMEYQEWFDGEQKLKRGY